MAAKAYFQEDTLLAVLLTSITLRKAKVIKKIIANTTIKIAQIALSFNSSPIVGPTELYLFSSILYLPS